MSNSSRRAHLGLLCGVAAAMLAAQPAVAQSYPSRPITLVVPFAPGTGVDMVARLLGERLAQKWKVAVTVDNRVGAGGTIGTDYVAKAKGDGHTLLFTGPPHYINEFLYKKLPYAPRADFKPVVKVSEAPLVLVVSKDAPVNDLRTLIALAKSQPRQLTFSSGGNGSTPHLAGALFNTMAGIDITHVPYKSGSQALTDVLGRQVLMTFTSVATGAQPVKGGLARALAVTGAKRSQLMPEVPTIAEVGVPGYEMVTWNGILAPVATPDAIVAQIAAAVLELLKDQALTAAIKANGLELSAMDTKSFNTLVQLESNKWQKLVPASGAKID